MRRYPTLSRRTTSSVGGIEAAASSRQPHQVALSRPPILLQFSAHHTVSAGHVGSTVPKHCVELPVVTEDSEDGVNDEFVVTTTPAQVYFQLYAAPIERLYHLLVGGSNSSSSSGSGANASSTTTSGGGISSIGSNTNSNKRRVIVLHSQGLYPNRQWKLGVSRILYDVLGVMYVSFQSTIQMIPFAFNAAPTTESTTVAPTVLLSVVLSATDAQCMVYASGHMLEYTFQSCRYNHIGSKEDHRSNTIRTIPAAGATTVGELRRWQLDWLSDTNPTLILTVLRTLIECPMALRKHAIRNLAVAGTVLVDSFENQLAQRLNEYLTRDKGPHISVETTTGINTEEAIDHVASPVSVVFTHTPINCKGLRSLAEHIAVVSLSSGEATQEISSRHRYEVLPWLGTSIWANYWYQYEQEQGKGVEQWQWLNLTESTHLH